MKTIVDVSSVVYGGHNGNDRRIRGFPVGGIRKLFGLINSGLAFGDFILCFDGGEILKKELYPTYKAGRIPDYSVYAQLELAKELLTKCNIPYYQDAKYEADDFIFSTCLELCMLGDQEEITIYSDDRDVSCCVTESICVKNVTSNGKCISRNTFENHVVRDRSIPYNTILLWKVFHGDASDHYNALSVPGLNFDSFSREYLSNIAPLLEEGSCTPLVYAEYDIFEAIAKHVVDKVSPENTKKFLERGRLVYPYHVSVSDTGFDGYLKDIQSGCLLYVAERKHMKIFGLDSFNTKKFNMYCSLLGLNRTKPSRRCDYDSAEAQDFFNLLELRAKELSSGVFAAGCKKKKVATPESRTIPNMDLP